ncbi:Taxadien-5-alpha-ol O-acetyltransferase [Handroanthus impetiginosus]|uniref:Taxadien-5-alpha-ol O-acetyltransferase n=1 Tax=Handroanthus impetiginosus TaxID=429701 RepID=A0A2G9GVJ8_9LAMI|nr:Taxadien-5-alpha-ol O-acetyltransferase [Handroanthus impetiginosus]
MAPSNAKTPIFLTKKEVVLVKPINPTPSEVLSFSTIDNDPHLEILCQTIYVYRSNTSLSPSQDDPKNTSPDPALVLKQALSKALVYYHPLAGKLKRQPDGTLQITCNSDGSFVFDWPSDSDCGYHPLLLQVTKFSCGGFTIGMGLCHAVCDGLGAAQFFRAMTELASGKNEPTIKPVWKRERLVGIVNTDEPFPVPDMNCFTKSPLLPTSNLYHECFNIDADTIKRIKTRLIENTRDHIAELKHLIENTTDQVPEITFTTVEVLTAYVWRSRFRALKQNPDGKTVLHLTVGIRNLVNPPLPEGYYGNAFVSANIVLSGKDLDKEQLCKIALLIKNSKKTASEADYITKALNFMEALRRKDMKIDETGASLVVTDWRHLKLVEELDFGWKGCVNMIPIRRRMLEFVSLCIFLPANMVNLGMEGGIRVLVSLPGGAMDVFKQEMDALKLGIGF